MTHIFFLIVVLSGDILGHLQSFLRCINYIILKFTPSTAPLYSRFSDSWNSFNMYHLHLHAFTCMCIRFFPVFTLLPSF
jgi:hypothetical protein